MPLTPEFPADDWQSRFRWVQARHADSPASTGFNIYMSKQEDWRKGKYGWVPKAKHFKRGEPFQAPIYDPSYWRMETVAPTGENPPEAPTPPEAPEAPALPDAGTPISMEGRRGTSPAAPARLVKPSRSSRLLRQIPSLQTPSGRVGAAVALFLTLLLLVVLLVKVQSADGQIFTRWQLAGQALLGKAVVA